MPIEPAPITAALRIGGRPPSHSHWSSTHGQTRTVTSRASEDEGDSTRGKVSGRPQRAATFTGRIRRPRRARSVPVTAIGTTGAPLSSASRPTPRFGVPSEPFRIRVPSGKITTASPRSSSSRAVSIMSSSLSPRRTGKAPSAFRIQACQRLLNSSFLATKWTGRRWQAPMMNGSRNERWLAASSTPPAGMCSRPSRRRRKYTSIAGTRIARVIQ